MYYVEKVLEILNSNEGSDYERFMRIYEEGLCTQNYFTLPKPAEPDIKDRNLGLLILSLVFFDSRRVPSEYWDDLCPDYLLALREYAAADLTRDHEEQRLPAVQLAIDKNRARAKELVERGVYDWTQYNSWFTMGDY